MPLLDQITIVGMGLIGGSLGMAAKKKKIARRVVGVVRDKKQKAAILKAKAADEVVTEYVDAIPGAGLVILAVPVSAMEPCAKDVSLHISDQAVVTDACSVKGPVVESLDRIFARKGKFIGSHPMAGSEKSGIAAARSDLFEKALCILTPTPGSDPAALKLVQKFWSEAGSKTCLSTAQDHDRIIAAVSHLPHVMAAALMHATLKAGEGFEDPIKFIGPSFRDMTRVAGSSPELWADILLFNRSAVLRACTAYVEQLEALKEALERRDRPAVADFFAKARALREKIS